MHDGISQLFTDSYSLRSVTTFDVTGSYHWTQFYGYQEGISTQVIDALENYVLIYIQFE